MSYENVKLWFAKDSNEQIITIDEIDESNVHNTYLCPVCGSDLLPKATKSKRITPHFAHVDASKCNSESQIHFWFKHKFLEKGDTFAVISDEERDYIVKDILVEEPYETENGVYKPDVTIITECGNTIYFEMAFTNKKQVKDYLDIWLELKNIVVEIDIKQLIMKDQIPAFKALFYEGKCFNIKRNDTYYNTIGKYKEEKLKGVVNNELKEQIRKLDWFWNDVFRYKKGEVDIEHMANLIESIKEDERNLIDSILNKQSCLPVLEDYIKYKSKVILNEVLNYFKGHWILNKREISVSHPFKSWKDKRLTSELRIFDSQENIISCYDVLLCSISDIIFKINNIITDIERIEDDKNTLEYAKNNTLLHKVIGDIEYKYKNIDEDYSFYNRFGYSCNVTFYYNHHEKLDFHLPKEIVYSNDEDFIYQFFDSEIDKYIRTVNHFENKQAIKDILDNLKKDFNKIAYVEDFEEQKRIGRGKWKIENKKRNINYKLEYNFYSGEIVQIRINRLIDNYYNFGWIKPSIYIYKNKLFFGRAIIEKNNILDKEEIKVIKDYHIDIENILIDLIRLDMNNKCKNCSRIFKLDNGEMKFFIKKGFAFPKKCKHCRNKTK